MARSMKRAVSNHRVKKPKTPVASGDVGTVHCRQVFRQARACSLQRAQVTPRRRASSEALFL